jgi:hypothetical protein
MAEMAVGTMVKKFHELFFINAGTTGSPVWKQIKKATDNTISMNAETSVRDYIVDESPTTVLERYAPGMSFPITMYKGEEDYEYFYTKFFNLHTGADAETEILFVDYAHGSTSFNAWKADCVVVIDNVNPVESTITANITINGTVDTGTATVTAGVPVYASATQTEFIMTFTCTESATPEAGATIQCGGVTKITDALGKATFTLIDGETYTVGVTNGTEAASDIFEADSETVTMALAMV